MSETRSGSTVLEGEAPDRSTLITVICHLMTCYAMQPCGFLAANIERHLSALLNLRAGDELGDWTMTFERLQVQWRAISDRHARTGHRKAVVEARQSPSH